MHKSQSSKSGIVKEISQWEKFIQQCSGICRLSCLLALVPTSIFISYWLQVNVQVKTACTWHYWKVKDNVSGKMIYLNSKHYIFDQKRNRKHYMNTFSLVVKSLMVIAASQNWQLFHLDMNMVGLEIFGGLGQLK